MVACHFWCSIPLLSSHKSLQVNNLPVNILPLAYPGQSHAHSMHSADDLPKNVVANLNQGSAVKSMDFHPVQQTLLLGLLLFTVCLFPHLLRDLLVRRSVKGNIALASLC